MAKFDDESCKKILYESSWDKKQQAELERLIKRKDKNFTLALVDVVRRYDSEWIPYRDHYGRPACDALKRIGDASVVRPILESLRENARHDSSQNKFEHVLELFDALVAPAGIGAYRDLLESLAALGGHIGRFGANRLLMAEAAEKGAYERLKAADAALGSSSTDEGFSSALLLLQEDRGGLAIQYLVERSSVYHEQKAYDRDPRVSRIDDALAAIGAPVVPYLVRALRENAWVYVHEGAYAMMRRIGEASAPALMRLFAEEKDLAALSSLEYLYKKGQMGDGDKKALLAMNGKVLRAHSDSRNECGVHSDSAEVKVSL
jgi:hypothetical protein